MRGSRLKLRFLFVSVFITSLSLEYARSRAIGIISNPDESTWIDGDMKLGALQLQKSALGSGLEILSWPNGIIPYQLDSEFSSSEKDTIKAAMKDIEELTCIRFVPWNPRLHEYAVFIQAGGWFSGCWSYLGRNGSAVQTVNLETGWILTCIYKGTIMHELTHTIGYYHEQQRVDRDDFVTIHKENIIPGLEDNFSTYPILGFENSTNLPYDYDSVTHYSAYAYSRNFFKTIVPKHVPTDRIGQRKGYSRGDIIRIHSMYRNICNSPHPSSTPTDVDEVLPLHEQQ